MVQQPVFHHQPNQLGEYASAPTEQTPPDPIDEMLEKIIQDPSSDEGLHLEFKAHFNHSTMNCEAEKYQRNHPYVRKDPNFPEHDWGTYDYLARDSTDTLLAEAASMCNTEGGFVIAGLIDPKNNGGVVGVSGIDSEFRERGLDAYRQSVSSWLTQCFGAGAVSNLIIPHYRNVDGKTLLVLECKPSRSLPVFLQPLGTIFKHRSRSKKMLWVRVSDSKREISDPSEMMNWYNLRFTSN